LIAIGAWVSPEVALGGFHAKAGWLLFCGLALAIAFVALRSSYFTRGDAVEGARTGSPVAAYVAPLNALIATALCTGLLNQEGVDLLYPCRIAAALVACWAVWRGLESLLPSVSWHATGVGVAVWALWFLPELALPAGPADAFPLGLAALPPALLLGWALARALGLVLVIPLVEELAFRGFLLRWLSERDFSQRSYRGLSALAWIGSSLAFGVLHDKWIAGTLAGLCFAWTARRRGRLGDAIVAHAVANLLLGVSVLVSGRWSLL